MAILTTDLDVFGSGGGAATKEAWLGGAISSVELSPTIGEENLFANVGAVEAAAGSTKYRGIYFKNSHATISSLNTTIWISTETPSTDTAIRIALDLAGVNVVMDTIVDEDTAPAPAVSWSTAASKGAGIVMGTVPATQFYGWWVERVVTAAASAYNDDDYAFTIEGDTTA